MKVPRNLKTEWRDFNWSLCNYIWAFFVSQFSIILYTCEINDSTVDKTLYLWNRITWDLTFLTCLWDIFFGLPHAGRPPRKQYLKTPKQERVDHRYLSYAPLWRVRLCLGVQVIKYFPVNLEKTFNFKKGKSIISNFISIKRNIMFHQNKWLNRSTEIRFAISTVINLGEKLQCIRQRFRS